MQIEFIWDERKNAANQRKHDQYYWNERKGDEL
jgi:uncharacterized DUF497 family protein